MPDRYGWQTPEERSAVYRSSSEARAKQAQRQTLANLFTEKEAAAAQAKVDAQREAINNMTPREVWWSTLPAPEKQRISSWQNINKMLYPVPAGDWTTAMIEEQPTT